MSNETWPDGSPRDPRFRPSKTGIGWIFDGPEGAVGPFDLEGARNYERFILMLTITRTIEQDDADPAPTASDDDLLRAYDQAILANEVAQAETMATQHRLAAARQRWERRHYIDRDRSADGCPQAPKEPNGS